MVIEEAPFKATLARLIQSGLPDVARIKKPALALTSFGGRSREDRIALAALGHRMRLQ